MTLLTMWPYLLTIPALLIGLVLGWQLHAARRRRELADATAPLTSAAYAHTRLKDKHTNADGAKSEFDIAERQLDSIRNAVAKARQQADDLDREHAQLLDEIEVRREELQEDRRTLETLRQKSQTAQEQMLTDIDLGGEEIEELERMRDTYTQRINRLSQQVEEQLNQLDRLRRAYNENAEAAEHLRDEAHQVDVEYERLLRERQQRERDLNRVREQIAERTATLKGLLKQQHDAASPEIDESSLRPVSPRGGRPRLPGGMPRRLPDGRGGHGD